jgi:hypothetical protein
LWWIRITTNSKVINIGVFNIAVCTNSCKGRENMDIICDIRYDTWYNILHCIELRCVALRCFPLYYIILYY